MLPPIPPPPPPPPPLAGGFVGVGEGVPAGVTVRLNVLSEIRLKLVSPLNLYVIG